jgi:protein transport protein SEC23
LIYTPYTLSPTQLLSSQVDFRSKLWTCPFCLSRNHFPPHYAENISETNLPAELLPQFTTVEYELQSSPGSAGPPIFLFVVDTCIDEEDMEELKDSLQQTLNLIPETSLVGLITFGTHVMVHELGFTDCPKSYAFRGTKEYPAQVYIRLSFFCFLYCEYP